LTPATLEGWSKLRVIKKRAEKVIKSALLIEILSKWFFESHWRWRNVCSSRG